MQAVSFIHEFLKHPCQVGTCTQSSRVLDITRKSRRYVQLQYAPLLKKKMKGYFSDVVMRFVPENPPSAFIFVCKSSNNHPAFEKKAER